MKLTLVFLFVLCGAQLILSAPRNNEDEGLMLCLANAVAELGLEGLAEGARLLQEIWTTLNDLVDGRRRCMEIVNDRMRDTCLTTWTVGALADLIRLRNSIAQVTGDEAAQRFFEDLTACFGIDPDHPNYPDPLRKKILPF